MNILNKMKQGMLDSTKAIKEISSDVTELTKLKINLSKDLARIDELYYELGKKMYASFEKDPDIKTDENVFSALMEIQTTLERIKESEFKIESLKGIIKCEQCGYEVEENAKYCSNCGNKLKILTLEEMVKEDMEPEKIIEKEEIESQEIIEDEKEEKPE
ncbi:zinc-ribbon domain-containing protein [Crassaminicella profunda]|uniref:zinc-ribbon domain-containing protein n=1 Tax=Crassaminicella profunda TaxID=1286698 RepID=UPI001CA6363F|nr:zinc-ribbon domain-containing protein [Crassaminicella profunda]QZY54761.1 hydrogenase/urease maturation nickel metallochaperone HypA [Crassaminicella profunda]